MPATAEVLLAVRWEAVTVATVASQVAGEAEGWATAVVRRAGAARAAARSEAVARAGGSERWQALGAPLVQQR